MARGAGAQAITVRRGAGADDSAGVSKHWAAQAPAGARGSVTRGGEWPWAHLRAGRVFSSIIGASSAAKRTPTQTHTKLAPRSQGPRAAADEAAGGGRGAAPLQVRAPGTGASSLEKSCTKPPSRHSRAMHCRRHARATGVAGADHSSVSSPLCRHRVLVAFSSPRTNSCTRVASFLPAHLQEAEASQEAFVRLRREHEALQNKHKVRRRQGVGGMGAREGLLTVEYVCVRRCARQP
jgi:hypothetical protein